MNPSKPASQVLKSVDIRLLTEIGLLACGAGNTDASKKLFDGLRHACKNNPSVLIGLAMSYLESGEAESAANLLRQRYNEIEPGYYEYDVFFALCLVASGFRREAERVLQGLLQASDASCPAHRLATALIRNYLTDSRVVHLPEQAFTSRTLKRVT